MIIKSKILLFYSRVINMISTQKWPHDLLPRLLLALQSITNLNSSIIAPYWSRFRHIHRRPSRLALVVRNFSTVRNFTGWSCNPMPPTLIPEIQGNNFCLQHYLWPARHERPYLQLHYLARSSQDHLPTQLQPQTSKYRYLGWRDISFYIRC
jgi:hypothetical protein